MATFGELLDDLKSEVIADSDVSDMFSDDELFDFLWNADVEIAAMFGFPQGVSEVPVVDGEVVLPDDALAVRVDEVVVNGLWLELRGLSDVMSKREFPNGLPSVYYFNSRNPGSILVGAKPVDGSVALVEYTRARVRPSGSLSDVEAWGGVHSQFHFLIVLLAGDRVARAQGMTAEADYFFNRFRVSALPFANFLGIPAEPVFGELLLRGDVNRGVGE